MFGPALARDPAVIAALPAKLDAHGFAWQDLTGATDVAFRAFPLRGDLLQHPAFLRRISTSVPARCMIFSTSASAAMPVCVISTTGKAASESAGPSSAWISPRQPPAPRCSVPYPAMATATGSAKRWMPPPSAAWWVSLRTNASSKERQCVSAGRVWLDRWRGRCRCLRTCRGLTETRASHRR